MPRCLWARPCGSVRQREWRSYKTIYLGHDKCHANRIRQHEARPSLVGGVDFAYANLLFTGAHFANPDLCIDYAEDRFITVGFLQADLVVMVWTPRGVVRRIISARKANEHERASKNSPRRRCACGPARHGRRLAKPDQRHPACVFATRGAITGVRASTAATPRHTNSV